MAELPALTSKKVVSALKRGGFVEDRQRGGHLLLIHPSTRARTVVPMHAGRTIKKLLLRAILHACRAFRRSVPQFTLNSRENGHHLPS
ncbi:MAG: type II toxin-antitoxin system HicA family toxin [Bryobacteraceae bacterium]